MDVIVRKICNVLISVILTAMVISAAVLLVPHVFGYQPYSVLSGSMEPRYHVGSLIFVRPVKPEEIKTGDAVTFTLPGQEKTVATHRVVRIDPKAKTFTTKGDANGWRTSRFPSTAWSEGPRDSASRISGGFPFLSAPNRGF